MENRTRLLVLVGASIVLLALAGTAQAASSARLLAKYQPVTYFTADEVFRPTTVDAFVADSVLERYNPACSCWVVVDADPQLDTLPSSGAGWRLNQQPCSPAAGLAGEGCYATSASAHEPAPAVYGRVVRTGEKVVVQYWLFYYDDFYSYTSPPSGFIWQAHEGDWEVVNVVLNSDEAPLYVGYSQHCLGQRRSWSRTPRWSGHHPVVYVARGSHANYFSDGVHPWNSTCIPQSVQTFFAAAGLPLPNDYAGGEGAVAAGPAAFGAEATSIDRVSDSSPAWIAFPGTWGELQYLFAQPLGLPPQPSGMSPLGPAQHAVWTDPLGTLAVWPRG